MGGARALRSAAKRALTAALLLAALALWSCAGVEPFDYRSDRELKPGPGLFTGEAGAAVLYRK